jgi:Rieske 2Fe-2S family protein
VNSVDSSSRARTARASVTTLPREYYVSPEIFEREREKILFRQWTCAGHVADIPKVGDYFVHRFAGESLIIVRESEDRVRAHLNVCRHRGSQLATSDKGHVKRFVCPYHQWSYNLDGTLYRAPMMPDGDCIDYDKLALDQASVEVWAGLIFVNLSGTPNQSLLETLGPPPDGLLRLEPEKIKPICRDRLVIRANWKTLLENYLECYHCPGSHPELGIALDIQSSYDQTATWAGGCFLGGEPVRKGLVTVSMTGQLVSKPLGRHAESPMLEREASEGLGLLPVLSRALFHVDHAIVHVMNPLSVDKVEWTTTWYVHQDALPGVDYDIDRVVEVWRATNAEDKELCERNYRGVMSRWFKPGPLNPRAEGAIRPILDHYLQLMDA